MARIETTQFHDGNGQTLRTRKFKYLIANGTTTLQATGRNVIVSKINITNDDDNATWEVQDGAGNKRWSGICDYVGSWEYDVGLDSDGNAIDGLKIVIASVTGTLELQILWF